MPRLTDEQLASFLKWNSDGGPFESALRELQQHRERERKVREAFEMIGQRMANMKSWEAWSSKISHHTVALFKPDDVAMLARVSALFAPETGE